MICAIPGVGWGQDGGLPGTEQARATRERIVEDVLLCSLGLAVCAADFG